MVINDYELPEKEQKEFDYLTFTVFYKVPGLYSSVTSLFATSKEDAVKRFTAQRRANGDAVITNVVRTTK